MKLKDSKSALLNNNQIPIWNFYLDIADVPKEHKDQVVVNGGYQLLAQATDSTTSVNGIYAWDGQSWSTVGQANAAIAADAGATGSRPSNPVVGRLYWDTTIDKLIVWKGDAWVDTQGSAP